MKEIDLKLQLENILNEQPKMKLYEDEAGFSLSGEYHYSLKSMGVVFDRERKIKLNVPFTFPLAIPTLFINELPEGISHVYKDNSTCVATIGEIVQFLIQNPYISDYIDKFVNSFLFTVDWYCEYETYPFGEREHGYKGLFSYYKRDWGLNLEQFKKMSFLVYNKTYRGHSPCFCDSGEKLRNCHGEKIFVIVQNEILRNLFLQEAYMILNRDKRYK